MRRVGNGLRPLYRLFPNQRWANRLIVQWQHWLQNGRFADTANPKTFSDYMAQQKLALCPDPDGAIARSVCKAAFKDMVTERIGPGHVPETLALIDSPQGVDSFVPDRPCVIKPTHLTSEVILNRGTPLTPEDRRRMKRWFRENHFWATREPGYRDIAPRIIVEEFLDAGGGPPDDIKIWCFSGRPKIILVDHARFSGHARYLYDIEGNPLPFIFRHGILPPPPFEFPDHLAELLRYSELLSAGRRFTRVDFYVVGDRILVGELTNIPASGNISVEPASADARVCALFDNPELPLLAASFPPIEGEPGLMRGQ